MFPFWADVPLTTWLQLTAVLTAIAGWLAGYVVSQGQRC